MAWEEFGSGHERGGVLRFLGPLAPEGVRRAARVERVVEEMYRAAVRRGDELPDRGFDIDRGASGRPSAKYEHPGGPQAPDRTTVSLNKMHSWGERLTWSDLELTVEEASSGGRVFLLPVVPHGGVTQRGGRRGAGEVAEVALFVSGWLGHELPELPEDDRAVPVMRGSLHFLNAQGYAVLVVPEVGCAWREVAKVIRAAGLPFHLYACKCSPRAAEEIASLLFPHRRSCVKVHR